MYNTDLPKRADLPTSAQLRRSTWIAGISAAAILTFIVLPSEYAIDPTGVGRMMGLTQMGEIKTQLADEAEQDATASASAEQPPLANPFDFDPQIAGRLDRIETMLEQITVNLMIALPAEESAGSASQERKSNELETRQAVPSMPIEPAEVAPSEERFAETEPAPATPTAANAWRDELSVTLSPGQGTEIKLVMEEGQQAEFYWTANGAVVNYDTHGDGGGNSISYEKGRGVGEQEGLLEAAFSGNHGWFWRNRTDADVTLTLRTRGAYSELKRAM